MGRLVYHRKKDSGTTYVYEVMEEHWDKERKQMRSKQVCIGKLDPVTGELIPSKRNKAAPPAATTASTSVIGPLLILDQIAQETGLLATLKKAFPETWDQILTLSYFLVCTGDALVHADAWCRNHAVPASGPYASQRMSDWLAAITEDGRQTFFKVWGKRIIEQDYLCYDITSISSYSELNEFVHYGYNRDGESLPQINLAMVYGQKSRLPVTYRILPGAIGDVSTIRKLLASFDKLDYPSMSLVMDRGFYSRQNVTDLFDSRCHFIIGLPSNRKWVRDVIDQCQDALHSPRGYRQLDMDSLYMHTELFQWPENKRRCYMHIYYDPHRAADDFEALNKRLLVCKEELESGKLNKSHESDYEQYFIVKETPARGRQVDYNDAAIRAFRDQYAGFFAILTTKKMDALEALTIYRNKDVVEKTFDDLKNALDMKRLRIHSSGRMAGRVFVQFIALILFSQIMKTMREKKLSGRYSPKLLLGELESLTKIHYTGKYNDIITEVSKAQREILEAFSIDPNTL
jgi:transposase